MRIAAVVAAVAFVWVSPALADKPKHKLINKKDLNSAKVGKLCATTWPRQKKAKRAVTVKCMQYWLFSGSYEWAPSLDKVDFSMDAIPDNRASQTAARYRQMAKHVRAAFGDGDGDWLVMRAIEFFDGSAETYTRFFDMNVDFLDALKAVMAGKPLPKQAYDLSSSGVLWLLRNSIYARHGRKFKHPDLNHYFYGKWKRPAKAAKLLPVKVNPKFKDSMLTKTDRANVRLIRKYERGEIETKF